jgi:CRISPR/Cas system CSM-associated protein Csm2 small subunit
MTTEEIKTILHESIENIEDEKFLEAIRAVVEPKYKTIPSLKISEKHKKILDESVKQIEDGDFYTNEEAKKISTEWLKD